MEAKAEQDPGFKKMLSKNRLGLVKVTDNDLKMWEQVLSLPFWLQENTGNSGLWSVPRWNGRRSGRSSFMTFSHGQRISSPCAASPSAR